MSTLKAETVVINGDVFREVLINQLFFMLGLERSLSFLHSPFGLWHFIIFHVYNSTTLNSAFIRAGLQSAAVSFLQTPSRVAVVNTQHLSQFLALGTC